MGPGAPACGAITAKLSVTVTSGVGPTAGGAGGRGAGGRASSLSLPSTTAPTTAPAPVPPPMILASLPWVSRASMLMRRVAMR